LKNYLEKERDLGTVYDTVDPKGDRAYASETEVDTRRSWLANWMDASKALSDAPSPKGKVIVFHKAVRG
jgi:hypothetical protein